MGEKVTAQMTPVDMGSWYEEHPRNPEPGASPIMEVILWQLPDGSGIVRTYNFDYRYIKTPEQNKALGLAMHELLDGFIRELEKIGVIYKMSDEEIRQHMAVKKGESLH